MISDVLTFKGFRGWTCGEDAGTLTWDAKEAGRPIPDAAEIAAWEQEFLASRAAKEAQRQDDVQAIADAKADAVVQQLVSHSPTQVMQYVRNQVNANGVTNLATAKASIDALETMVAKLAVALWAALRDKLR